MVIRCPGCARVVPYHEVRVGWDLAQCAACGATFALSGGSAGGGRVEVELGNPPPGVTIQRAEHEVIVRASTRSSGVFVLAPVTLLWSALWIGATVAAMRVGDRFVWTWWLLVFVPLHLISVLLGICTFMRGAGRVEVRIAGERGRVFSGVGPLGWRRRFAVGEVRGVTEFHPKDWWGWAAADPPLNLLGLIGFCRNPFPRIALLGQRRILFGSFLGEEQRRFMIEALGQSLRGRRSPRGPLPIEG